MPRSNPKACRTGGGISAVWELAVLSSRSGRRMRRRMNVATGWRVILARICPRMMKFVWA
jgi:hypothetical protein